MPLNAAAGHADNLREMIIRERDAAGWATACTTAGELAAALAALDWSAANGSEVEALLRTARIGAAGLIPFTLFVPGRYTRNCVYRDDRFELLVLCWSAGVRSAIHDHGSSRCFVRVAQGELEVEDYAIAAGGGAPGPAHLRQTATSLVPAGAVDVRTPVRDIHRVSASRGQAISLHVYARPLESCLIFDPARRTCRSMRTAYDLAPRP